MITYLFQVTLCWGLFALLYTLMLRRETFFQANRFYLLLAAVTGICLPLAAGIFPAIQGASEEPIVVLPALTIGLQQADENAARWSFMSYLWWAYWAGFVVVIFRTLFGLVSIAAMAADTKHESLPDGCRLIRTSRVKLPLSFFHWIFVPRDFDSGDTNQNMLAHEQAHARAWHSLDVLLMELLCITFWFHPLVHWFRRSLRTVHEYQADAEASSQTDKKQYSLLLLQQAGVQFPVAVANHFFQSPLKQRLNMLLQNASTPGKIWKYCLTIPAILVSVIISQHTEAAAQTFDSARIERMRQLEANNWIKQDTFVTFDSKTYEKHTDVKQHYVGPEEDINGQMVYKMCDRLPEFPGGFEALSKYVSEKLVYPSEDLAHDRTGQVVVDFIVNTDGEIEKVVPSLLGGSPSQAMFDEATRVIQSMPPWIPAQHRGQIVKCQVRLPIHFALK